MRYYLWELKYALSMKLIFQQIFVILWMEVLVENDNESNGIMIISLFDKLSHRGFTCQMTNIFILFYL